MWIFGHARAFRAVLVACGLTWAFTAVNLSATTLDASGSVAAANPAGLPAEPFGLFAAPLDDGGLRDKWLAVEHELDDEMLVLTLCQEDRSLCRSLPAQKFLVIVDDAKAREGRARLGEINRAINLAIRPVSDIVQYGSIDVWSSPLATFTTGAGDCEDYAIAKLVALRLAGVAAEDLRLVILRDTMRQEDHAMVAVRLDGRWLTLDNRHLVMIEDTQLRHYQPTFVIDRNGVREYRASPSLLAEQQPASDAASPAGIGSGATPGG
jgi:predicted transglutaminase-like cysteine proteinase